MFSRTYSSTNGSPERSSTRSTNGPRISSGSGSRCRTRHTVRTNARGSAGVTDLGSSQVLTSPNPARVSRSAVSASLGVVPRPLPVREVRRERLLAGDRVGQRPEARRCCRARRTGRPAGRRAPARDAAPRTARRGRGSSGRWRSRRSRRPARATRARPGPGRARWRGRRAHRARAPTIDGATSTAYTRPRGTRSASSAVTRPDPQPASSTTSLAGQLQPRELLARPGQLRIRDAVVARRIPVPGRSPGGRLACGFDCVSGESPGGDSLVIAPSSPDRDALARPRTPRSTRPPPASARCRRGRSAAGA